MAKDSKKVTDYITSELKDAEIFMEEWCLRCFENNTGKEKWVGGYELRGTKDSLHNLIYFLYDWHFS